MTLLQEALNGPSLVRYSEDPREDRVPGNWSLVGPSLWWTERVIDAPSVAKWLYLGGWVICDAPRPEFMDRGQCANITRNEDLTRRALDCGAAFVINSFYDNREWEVLVNRLPKGGG